MKLGEAICDKCGAYGDMHFHCGPDDLVINEITEQELIERVHALNAFNLDQSFTITKRELLEKLK